MELDLDIVKNVLEDTEKRSDGIEILIFSVTPTEDESLKRFGYHLRILLDAGFIEQVGSEERTMSHGYTLLYIGLTYEGHQLLDCMRNDTSWNKIKSNLQIIGIEGLKQIPALAIGLVLQNLKAT